MSLVATCPNCGTVFSMVREQLEASSGQVRCGHCMEVFDAKTQQGDAQMLDLLGDANPDVTDAPPNMTLSFVEQAKKRAFWSSTMIRSMMAIAAMLLLFGLSVQVLRTERERLVQAFPSLQPTAQKLCRLWTCPVSARLQIEGWRIESSSFQKEGANAFRLGVQLQNTSPAALLVPQLELSLLDASDALLVRRVIALETAKSLASGEERSYSFLISPQVNLRGIVGYRLVLFYP
jgi:predicted Zn finger-like uncharacterized protein